VLANTGVKVDTVRDILAVADGAIVGTSLKVDGDTWKPVEPARVVAMMEAVADARAAGVGG
jgi:predicted TIM-barrel enzyme